MANGGTITNEGRNAMLNRNYKSSPDNAAFTKFVVGTGTTTPATSDTYSTFSGVPSGFPKTVVSSSLDTTNQKVVVRGYVAPSEANGSTLTEVGETNTDGSPKAFSRDVYTAISKTSSDELVFVITHQVT